MAPQGLSVWARAQRTLQPVEAWNTFKDWLDERNPRFAFSVARQLLYGSTIPAVDQSWAALMRQEARGRMAYLLPAGTILCLPTTPFPAPPRGSRLSALDPLRDRITCLCAQGGLAGHPQVSIPGATVDGLPVGLSIIGPRGSDASLVAVARALEGTDLTDLTPNIPEVVAEVSALFERYEQALIDKNVDVLDDTFWNSPHTIRLANARARLRLRSHPRLSRRPPARARHQGKAAAARHRHPGPRHRHGLAGLQGARTRDDRAADADLGSFSRCRLEGDPCPRLDDR